MDLVNRRSLMNITLHGKEGVEIAEYLFPLVFSQREYLGLVAFLL